MCWRELYAAHNTEEGNVTVTEKHIKAALITIQLSNCGERKGLWEHIGNSWWQLAKPAKRWIRETEITVVEKYCISGKGLKPSGTWHTDSALISACVQVLLVCAEWDGKIHVLNPLRDRSTPGQCAKVHGPLHRAHCFTSDQQASLSFPHIQYKSLIPNPRSGTL